MIIRTSGLRWPRFLEDALRFPAKLRVAIANHAARVSMFIMLLLATCCGGGTSAPQAQELAGSAAGGSALVERELMRLGEMGTPAGADPQQFARLKLQLADMFTRTGMAIASDAPDSAASQVLNLTAFDNGSGTARISWTYRNQGDYDQNSEVSVQDLSALGVHFGETSAAAFWNLAALADGDNNGEINSADLTPIAQYLGNTVSGYSVESSPDGSSWSELASMAFSESSVPGSGGPRRFSVEADIVTGTQLRVVPMHDADAGIASASVEYSAAPLPEYTISGFVLDSTSQPLAGQAVVFNDADAQLTAADGGYSFTGIADGTTGVVSVSPGGNVLVPRATWRYGGRGECFRREFHVVCRGHAGT